MHYKKHIVAFCAILLTAITAYGLGVLYTETVFKPKKLKSRAILTNAIKQKIGLEIGDTIVDSDFETLDFKKIRLGDVLQDTTLLIFFEPECYVCIEDIENLIDSHSNSIVKNVIFISSGNPRLIMDIRDDYDLKYTILYDHEGYYTSNLGITSYPFHLVVNNKYTISEIIAGKLISDDIKRIFPGK